MSEEKIVLTPEERFTVCNMNSTGTKLKDAIAKVVANRNGSTAAPKDEKKKPSAKAKKEALAKEIVELGGEAPEENASVAKFQEALTAAKAEKEAADEEAKNLM